MSELVSMWKSPKILVYFFFTTVLYSTLLYPVWQFSFFAENADFLRIAIGIPVAFSFLFGPAAAWGAAFGNLIFDAATGISWITPFGFLGNFLIGYIPYKLWSKITTEKPDLRSLKKIGLFIGVCALACVLCGIVIGWGLLYLFSFPFVITSFAIFASDFLWAVLLGSVILVVSYGFFNKRKLLYSDLLNMLPDANWNRKRSSAIIISIVTGVLCFIIPVLVTVDAWFLLPFVMLSLISAVLAMK